MNYTGIISEYFVTPVETEIEEKVTEAVAILGLLRIILIQELEKQNLDFLK